MSEAQSVLVFDEASLDGDGYDGAQHDIQLSVASGEQIFVRSERRLINLPLLDAAQGLVEPLAGRVLFCGEDWQSMTPRRQSVCRGATGRIFADYRAWLSNLDVDENITLRMRHHSTRAASEIVDEAHELAAELGLAELPAVRPPQVQREVLQICQCVRAFLGHPKLVLAEFPFLHMHDDTRERLLALAERRCAEGAAVVWLTQNDALWNLLRTRGRCFVASGEELTESES